MVAAIPGSVIVSRALEMAESSLSKPILNHSIRTAFYARAIADSENLNIDRDLVWVAALLHDLGTAVDIADPVRFEVTGASAAEHFVRTERHSDEQQARDVWDAIALHTSPQIAERRGGLTRALRLAVRTDFGGNFTPQSELLRQSVERKWPRFDVERVLADVLVSHAMQIEEKAPGGSWVHDLVVAHGADPERIGVNPAF